MTCCSVENTEYVMLACKNKVSVICSIFDILDMYRKIVLLMYLAEYISLKCRKEEFIRGDKYCISHEDVIDSYSDDIKESVTIVLSASDLTCRELGTPDQLRMWNMAWTGGHVEAVLKYEEFM